MCRGAENAGHENARHENARHENANTKMKDHIARRETDAPNSE